MSEFTFNMQERANFARELEYIKEDMDECGLGNCFDKGCDDDDYRASKSAVDQIEPVDDTRETEIDRLLKSERDMSFEKMIGAIDDVDDKQNLPVNGECGDCGSECGGCSSTQNPIKTENSDQDAPLNLNNTKQEMDALTKQAQEQVEESAEVKYIDLLTESADYLSSIAEVWDETPDSTLVLTQMVIESVFDEDTSTTILLKPRRDWFDGRQITITHNKTDGSTRVGL